MKLKFKEHRPILILDEPQKMEGTATHAQYIINKNQRTCRAARATEMTRFKFRLEGRGLRRT